MVEDGKTTLANTYKILDLDNKELLKLLKPEMELNDRDRELNVKKSSRKQ